MDSGLLLGLGVVVVTVVLYYVVGSNTFTILLVSITLLSYAVICAGGNTAQKSYILENKVTKFISGISMEIYLSHMVIFRIVERMGLNGMIGNGWMQYAATVVMVVVGAIVFAVVMQKVIRFVEDRCKAIRRQGFKDYR